MSANQDNEPVPATGWYRDPADGGIRLWADGQWTDEVHPARGPRVTGKKNRLVKTTQYAAWLRAGPWKWPAGIIGLLVGSFLALILLFTVMYVVLALTVGTVDESSPMSQTSDDEIAMAVGLERNGQSWYLNSQPDCYVPLILNTKERIKLYADAGDTVVTNRAGTVGVKVMGGDSACIEGLRQGLENVSAPGSGQ